MSVATANVPTYDVTGSWNPTAGVMAAIRAAWNRHATRMAYKDLLDRPDVLRGIGVTRDQVRQAMAGCR
jgi:GH18 family chitinase